MTLIVRCAVVVALALAGCLQSAVTACEDGSLCPAGSVCSAQGCVGPEQVSACADHADGERCTYGGGTGGRCVTGVCVSFACGNQVIEADQGEVCDDGNTGSGDGCRADCRKVERCGDGLLDEREACDDGNVNTADGCDACAVTTWDATARVGGSVAATSVGIVWPFGLAIDTGGNLFFADAVEGRIGRVDASTGAVTTVAGTGTSGYSGDGGLATSAQLAQPHGIAVDGLGTLYIADSDNHRIRRVDAGTGIITTVAGTGVPDFSGDGGLARDAPLSYPRGVAVDGLGTLYIADTSNQRIRRVDAGVISTVAGTGVTGVEGDGGPATLARLAEPYGIAADRHGAIFIADTANHRVRRVDPSTAVITTVAGTSGGFAGDDEAATTARLNSPLAVAVDRRGTLYIADFANERVRRVEAETGVITTVAGTGVSGFSGDGAAAVSARLSSPQGVAVDERGTLYIADRSRRVRRVDADTGLIGTAAGSGTLGFSGDGGAATSAQLGSPSGVALDGRGGLYLADTQNHRVRRVDLGTGVISTVAGTTAEGFAGDGGPATAAELDFPVGVAVDGLGNVFIVDAQNQRIRRVDATTGVISTVAGTGTEGAAGDGDQATRAELRFPSDVTVDGLGNLYIADTGNHRIRRVDGGTGVITTIAGTGIAGFSGDGRAAIDARVNTPTGVAVAGNGYVYVADFGNDRIRRIDPLTRVITTVAGTVHGYDGDGGPASSAQLASPINVAIDRAGHVYIADGRNNRVRRVDAATGIITTVAGTGTVGFSGDGGAATSAEITYPQGVAVDALGTLYVTGDSPRVRRVDGTTGIITTFAGLVDPERMGPLAQARLADPRALVVAPSFTLIAGGISGTVQVVRAAAGWLGVVAGRYPHATATANLARYRDGEFGTVGGVAHDPAAGVIYLSETTAHRVHVVTIEDPADAGTWTIAPLAGVAGSAGFADGAAATAQFRRPTGLHLDPVANRLYVADTGNHVIRAIDLATRQVTTLAGTPQTRGFVGDGGRATAALLFHPEAVTRCDNGDLFVADTANHRVRRIAAGVITTVLGDGIAASSGQGTPARDFPVHAPRGLACDALGNLYVTSTTTVRQAAADARGVVDGSGAVASIFGAPPRTFPATVSYCLTGLAIVDATTVRVADPCTGLLIELQRTVIRGGARQ